MPQRKGKRAVIISDIKSPSIEQAILILKTPAANRNQNKTTGSSIVTEAQDIINSYIASCKKPKEHPSDKYTKIVTWVAAACAVLASSVSLLLYFI